MPRHADTSLTAIKHAVDIVSVVGDSLTLIRTGSKYKALCPFHDDHNPSLEINPDRQSFKCWACGAGGDVFDFVQRMERVEFSEAKRMLAARAGITLETPQDRGATAESNAVLKSDLWDVLAWAENLFTAELARSPATLDYVRSRGITDDSIARFRLGLAPDSRDWLIAHAQRTGRRLELLEAAGLVTRNEESGLLRDRFRGRLIFPIQDLQGRTVAFGGRILPGSEQKWIEAGLRAAKYINSPESAIFQKRRTLYAANLARTPARNAGWIAVVEGYTDVIALHQAGLAQTVGTLGTALGPDHVTLLRRLADRVILVFDGDEAGQAAADRALELFLAHEIDLRVLTLPAGVDPADLALTEQPAEIHQRFESAQDPLEFAITRAAARYDFASPEGARQAAEWVLSIIARVPRSSRSGLDLKVAKALDLLARRLAVPLAELTRSLNTLRHAHMRRADAATLRLDAAGEEPPINPGDLDPIDRELVRILLAEPEATARLVTQITASSLQDPPLRAIVQSAFDLHARGEHPEYIAITTPLEPAVRSLAAALILPDDPGRLPDSVQPAPWHVRLAELELRLSERERQNRLRDLRAALAEIDPVAEPDTYQALRREFWSLNHQRPAARLTPAP